MNIPRWHLWGGSQLVTVSLDGTGAGNAQSGQLVKIENEPPLIWSWVIWAEGQNLAAAIAATITYAVTIGVGRASKTVPSWGVFQLSSGARNFLVSAEEFLTVRTTAGFPSSNAANILRKLPATDLQLNATVSITGGAANGTAAVEVGALFAPWLLLAQETE